jgi:glutaredoxin
MKDLNVIVYTMKGCPFCDQFKEMLVQEGIEFFDRDIDKYSSEYDTFSKITENDMIPALLIIEGDGENYESFLYAPDRNYNELTEAVDIIKEHRKKIGIIK